MTTIRQRILDTLSGHPGIYAVAFRNLATGEEILIREKETFHAASTMKVPVMIAVFKQAAAGRFSLSDPVMVKNTFKSIVDNSEYRLHPEDDSEQDLYHQAGTQRPLSDLVCRMIIKSSNLATNIVIELVGGQYVTQAMRELGAKDIQVLRGVEDGKAYRAGLNNTTTAYDLMLIFEKMAQGATVSPAASKEMINILLDQRFNSIIPAQLPAGVKVAHKTGEITGVRHDAGIVFLPDGRRYVLVLLSKELESAEEGAQAMAAVSRMIYGHVTGK